MITKRISYQCKYRSTIFNKRIIKLKKTIEIQCQLALNRKVKYEQDGELSKLLQDRQTSSLLTDRTNLNNDFQSIKE